MMIEHKQTKYHQPLGEIKQMTQGKISATTYAVKQAPAALHYTIYT